MVQNALVLTSGTEISPICLRNRERKGIEISCYYLWYKPGGNSNSLQGNIDSLRLLSPN